MPNGEKGDEQNLLTPIVTHEIPEVVVPAETRSLRFSFRHLDTSHIKFRISDCGAEYLRVLLEQIKNYSQWTVDDFCDQNNNEHRHTIDFSETSEHNGFTNAGIDQDQLAYNDAWQFQLIQTEDWRVHGILVDDTFYVVWLDQNHNLYPRG
jgi:hypothetical protein